MKGIDDSDWVSPSDLLQDSDQCEPKSKQQIWQMPWNGLKHRSEMPEDWFPVSGIEHIVVPLSRFATSKAARKWFEERYVIICYAHSPRAWTVFGRSK